MSKRMTTKEFISKCKTVHNDRYCYDKTVLVNSTTKVTITCNEHGDFYQRPNHHKGGQGCPKCKISKQTICYDEFVSRAKKVHGDKYCYDKVILKSMSCKIIIGCPNHGDFEVRPFSHLKGTNCNKCVSEKSRLSTSEFISKVSDVHFNKYTYNEINYTGYDKPINIECPHHGTFTQIAKDHLTAGCPHCNESKGEKEIAHLLESLNVDFERQWKDNRCQWKRALPFDFYLPELNKCIEFDGQHHFKPVTFNGSCIKKAQMNFELQKKKDAIKTSFCDVHNIDLLRISYKDNIENAIRHFLTSNNQ